MEESPKKSYSLYDSSRQTGIVRKKNTNDGALNLSISFNDPSIKLNNKNINNETIKEK